MSLPCWDRGSVLRGHAASREVLLLLGAAELSCWLEAPWAQPELLRGGPALFPLGVILSPALERWGCEKKVLVPLSWGALLWPHCPARCSELMLLQQGVGLGQCWLCSAPGAAHAASSSRCRSSTATPSV